MTHTVNKVHLHLHHYLPGPMSFDDPWASPIPPCSNNVPLPSTLPLQHDPSFACQDSFSPDPPSNPAQPLSKQPLIRAQSTSASHPLKPDLPSPLPSDGKLPSPVHPLSDATRPALKRLTADHPPAAPADSSSKMWFARQNSPRPLSPKGKEPALLPTPLAENPNRIKGERDVLIHQVAKHDTLPGIALSYGISLSALRKANGLWPSDPLSLRSTLRIPLGLCSLPPAKRIGIEEQTLVWDDWSGSSGSRSSAAAGLATRAGSGASSERGRSEDSGSGGRGAARHDDAGPSTLRQRAPRRTLDTARRPHAEPLQIAGLGPVDGPEVSPGLEKKRLIQHAFSGTQRPALGLDSHDIPAPPQTTTTTMGSKWTTVRPGKPPPLSKQLKFLEDSATGTTNKLGMALQQALDGLFAPGPTQTCSPVNGASRLVELDQIDGTHQAPSRRTSCTGGAGSGLWDVWTDVVGGSSKKTGNTGKSVNNRTSRDSSGIDGEQRWINNQTVVRNSNPKTP